MDPLRNPFAPGAGTAPPELAGRDPVLERAGVALGRMALERPARSFVFYGLRGTGKTVLLQELARKAECAGVAAVHIEAQEGKTLAAMLVPPLRALLLKLSHGAQAKAAVLAALGALQSFALRFAQVKLRFAGMALDVQPARGVADSGNLELDLADLLVAVAEAARARHRPVALFLDEMQILDAGEAEALVAALHVVAQRNLPLLLMGAGLPPLLGRMGTAKSYAERLFEFAELERLDHEAAWNAIVRPIEREEEAIEPDAVAAILEATGRYPYFLQEWGKHAWDVAFCSPVTRHDVEEAGRRAVAELDRGFFRVRLDRLTPAERRYVAALAGLGPGVHRSGEVAHLLARSARQLAPVRSRLVYKGILYAPAHGDTAFTVPMFDAFIRRTLPGRRPAIKTLREGG